MVNQYFITSVGDEILLVLTPRDTRLWLEGDEPVRVSSSALPLSYLKGDLENKLLQFTFWPEVIKFIDPRLSASP